jgi:hypothetical protein
LEPTKVNSISNVLSIQNSNMCIIQINNVCSTRNMEWGWTARIAIARQKVG